MTRRIILICMIIGMLAAGFWASSRYPALQGKSNVAGVIQLEDFLTHEAHLPVSQAMPFFEKVGRSTINWIITNWKGMAFAIFLAPAFLVLLGYLPQNPSGNRLLSSIYGMVMGTPLGVCVNCVAPISKAIYEGSRNTQMALAVMFSSPGLNIVVLTMLFSLFPLYIALLKLGMTFLLILGIVPFMAPRTEINQEIDVKTPLFSSVKESWLNAGGAVAESYGKAFLYIFIRTVPFMFLAGFLGALLSHLWDPSWISTQTPGFLMLSAVAVFGTFLPLPIAFDVMLAHAFMTSHMPINVVATLLFTLGIFSIYSFFIVWRSFSLKLALLLYIIVSILGVVVGYAADYYAEYEYQQWLKHYEEEVLQD